MSVFESIKQFYFKKEIQDMIDKSIAESKRSKVKKNEEISTKQQILILHYLGLLSQIKIVSTQKKALLLSKLLNRNEQNVREYLTYVDALKIEESDLKTKNNLEEVLSIFESVGLIEESKLVINDLEKIDKMK